MNRRDRLPYAHRDLEPRTEKRDRDSGVGATNLDERRSVITPTRRGGKGRGRNSRESGARAEEEKKSRRGEEIMK